MSQRERESGFPLRIVVAATVTTSLAIMPVYLTGAYAVQIRGDLNFTPAGIGLAVSAFFFGGAIVAPFVGRVTQRVGPLTGLRAGPILTAAGLLAIAAATRSWGVLVALLVIAGVGNATGQTAANLALASQPTRRYEGLTFGIKQAAVPLSTTLVGASVPIFALTIGWRWVFVGGGVLALLCAFGAPRLVARDVTRQTPAEVPARQRRGGAGSGPINRPMVALMSVAAFFGSGPPSSLAAFLVESAVAAGWEQGSAGLLLSVSSASGLIVRVWAGWAVDRRGTGGHLALATLTSLGMLGFLLLAAGDVSTIAMALGAVLGLGAGWGWQGLLHFTVVAANRGAAATATGWILASVFSGGVVIPAMLGFIVDVASFRAAWLTSMGAMVIATAAVLIARRYVRSDATAA